MNGLQALTPLRTLAMTAGLIAGGAEMWRGAGITSSPPVLCGGPGQNLLQFCINRRHKHTRTVPGRPYKVVIVLVDSIRC